MIINKLQAIDKIKKISYYIYHLSLMIMKIFINVK